MGTRGELLATTKLSSKVPFSLISVEYAQDSVILEWETKLKATSTASQLAWVDVIMEVVNAESVWKEVKGKEAQLVNDKPAENWRSNGKVPTSNSCSDSRRFNFTASRTCMSVRPGSEKPWSWLQSLCCCLARSLIPSCLVVDMAVLVKSQPRLEVTWKTFRPPPAL